MNRYRGTHGIHAGIREYNEGSAAYSSDRRSEGNRNRAARACREFQRIGGTRRSLCEIAEVNRHARNRQWDRLIVGESDRLGAAGGVERLIRKGQARRRDNDKIAAGPGILC